MSYNFEIKGDIMKDKGSLYSKLYYIFIAIIIIAIILVVMIFYNTRKSPSKPASDRYSDFNELKSIRLKIKIGKLLQSIEKISVF